MQSLVSISFHVLVSIEEKLFFKLFTCFLYDRIMMMKWKENSMVKTNLSSSFDFCVICERRNYEKVKNRKKLLLSCMFRALHAWDTEKYLLRLHMEEFLECLTTSSVRLFYTVCHVWNRSLQRKLATKYSVSFMTLCKWRYFWGVGCNFETY